MNAIPNRLLEHMLFRLAELDDLRFTGFFPDAVHLIGNRFPAVLVEDGDHPEYHMESGRRVQYTYLFHLWLYHNLVPQRVITLNELTDRLIQTVLGETGFDSAIRNLQVVAVEKGEVRNEPVDFLQPGMHDNLTIRCLSFSTLIEDQR